MEKWGMTAAVAIGLFLGMGVKHAGNKQVEAESLTLRSAQGSIELTAKNGPSIRLLNAAGKETAILSLGEQGTTLALNDSKGQSRMEIHGGDAPAVYMKNDKSEIVGAMLMLQDGGGAIGLADSDGDVSALMRGGVSPSVGLFQKTSEPSVAFGINNNVPHMLLTSHMGKDSMVMHGGDTSSLLFVDQAGEVSIFLSKHGLYQGQKEEKKEEKQSDGKVFTWQGDKSPLKDFKLSPR